VRTILTLKIRFSAFVWLHICGLLVVLCPHRLFGQERSYLSVEPLAKGRTYFQAYYATFGATEEFSPPAIRRRADQSLIPEGTRLNLFETSTENATSFPVRDAELTDRRLNFLYEYGVTERYTLSAALDVRAIQANYEEQDIRIITTLIPKSVSASGFGELWVYNRYGFVKPGDYSFPIKVSGVVGIKFPTGDFLARVPLGTGTMEYEGRLLTELNLRFNQIPGYVLVDAGYRYRAGSFQNQLLSRIEAGVLASKEITVRGAFITVLSDRPFLTLQGVGELPSRDATRPLTVIGDERVGSISLGLLIALEKARVSIDYNYRMFGSGTFAGSQILFTIGFLR
jgi:hypothetical protein